MSIDPAIVRQCNENAERYLGLYRIALQGGVPKTPPPSSKAARPKSARNDDRAKTNTKPINETAASSRVTLRNSDISHSRNSSYGGQGSPTSKKAKRSSTIKAVAKDNSEDDLDTEAIIQTLSSEEIETPPKRRRRKSTTSQSEEVAAQMLMLLGREDAACGRGPG